MSLVNINDERERFLWEQTFSGNESSTTEFWAYLFKEKIFKGPDFSIAPEAPPTQDASDRRRVDLIIKQWQPSRHGRKGKFGAILFYEAKKHQASQTEIDALETQAFTASIAWLLENDAHEAYAMTAVGPTAKLWYTTIDNDYPYPMVPAESNPGDRTTYIAANSTDAQDLQDGFATILRYPQGLPELQMQVLASNATPPKPVAQRNQYDSSAELQQPQFDYGTVSGFNLSVSPIPKYTYSLASTGLGSTVPAASYTAGATTTVGSDDGIDMIDEEGESEEEEEEAGEKKATAGVQANSRYVDVSCKVVKQFIGSDKITYLFTYEGKLRETTKSQWKRSTYIHEGSSKPCKVYTSRGGTQFWTWTLPDVKGKKKSH